VSQTTYAYYRHPTPSLGYLDAIHYKASPPRGLSSFPVHKVVVAPNQAFLLECAKGLHIFVLSRRSLDYTRGQ